MAILDLQNQPHKTKWNKRKKIGNFLRVLYLGIMPRPSPNFVIGLDVTITIFLGSTQPKHSNTKILQFSFLVISFSRSKTRNVTQKLLKKNNYSGLVTFFTRIPIHFKNDLQKSYKWYVILRWKASCVFTRL